MQNLAITWLGHSSFRLRTPGGKEVLFDPWYTGNPSFPADARPKAADLILISHGHSDHITDAAAMAKDTGATVAAIWEITSWLGSKGIKNLEPEVRQQLGELAPQTDFANVLILDWRKPSSAASVYGLLGGGGGALLLGLAALGFMYVRARRAVGPDGWSPPAEESSGEPESAGPDQPGAGPGAAPGPAA